MGMKVLLRIAICVLIIIGGGAGFYFMWAQPIMKHDTELAHEIEDRQRALADLERSTAGIDDINRKIKELQDAVQFFESKLPQEKEVETILAQVWKMAEANSLQARTIKSGKTEDQLVTMQGGRPVATTVQLPKNLMDKYVFELTPELPAWAVSRFPTQVLFTYREITQGKPYSEIAGGK